MQIESKRNIVKYIFAFGGVQGLNIAIGLIRNKLVALLLGPSGMGIMAIYNSSVQLIQNACNLGLDKSTIPSLSYSHETESKCAVHNSINKIRSLFAVGALIAIAVCICFSWAFSLVVFSELRHSIHFVALSPVAAFLILCGGEMAILKATRQLKRLALLSICNVIISLVVSVPMFFIWKSRAIIPSLILTVTAQFLVIICYSYSRYPLHIYISKKLISDNMPIIRLGIAFVIASTMSSGAEFFIRAFLKNQGCYTTVGLYNAAYMIAFTYGASVFSAIDSEYFPRLSKTNDATTTRITILRQIKVCLMIIIPMVIGLYILLPWIIPLLFSNKFIGAVPMAQITLLAMIPRAIYLPIGYLPLACNDSKCFLFMEVLSSFWLTICVLVGFSKYDLIGSGIGIVIANILDMLLYLIILRKRFNISLL